MDTYAVELTPYIGWTGQPSQPIMLVSAQSRARARACAEHIWSPDRTVVSITNLRTGVKL